jgi:hypothetical protein
MALKLDKTRDDCCDVFPPENGAHFYQRGFYFDQNGDVVRHPDLFDEKAAARLKRLEALDKANEAAKDARRKALEEAGEDPDAANDNEDDDAANDNETQKVDLRAWLTGRSKLIFPLVQAAIRDQHGVNATSKKQAIEFLVGELGMVAPEDVRVI